VAQQVLGTRRLRGVLVVNRYHADNRAPCARQYCYAHLRRDVQDMEKEFPGQPEIQRCVAALLPRWARAMHLRGLSLSAAQFRQQAAQTRREIVAVTAAPALPLGGRPGRTRRSQPRRAGTSSAGHCAPDQFRLAVGSGGSHA